MLLLQQIQCVFALLLQRMQCVLAECNCCDKFNVCLQSAIAARFAAWAPMTEEEFAHYTPRFMAAQEEAEWQRQHAIACKGCHYKLPVPTDQGQRRVALHYIIRDAHPFSKAAQQKPEVSIGCFHQGA